MNAKGVHMNYEFCTTIGMLAAGFGWLIYQNNKIKDQLHAIDNRLTVVETILSMMGYPVKYKGDK